MALLRFPRAFRLARAAALFGLALAVSALAVSALAVSALGVARAVSALAVDAAAFTLEQVKGYPFPSELTAAATGSRIAWVFDERGIRNVWVAEAPEWKGRRLTSYDDDGQELTSLAISKGVPYDELVIVDDTHDFLLASNRLRVNRAIAEFLERRLGAVAR